MHMCTSCCSLCPDRATPSCSQLFGLQPAVLLAHWIPNLRIHCASLGGFTVPSPGIVRPRSPMLLKSYPSSLSLHECLSPSPAPANLNSVLNKRGVITFTRPAPMSQCPAMEEAWQVQTGFNDWWEASTKVGAQWEY